MDEDKKEVVLSTVEPQNQTRVCGNCNKLIYNSELCSCETAFRDQPTWYQNILNETKEQGKVSNNIG